MHYTEIKPDLFLVMQEVPKPAKAPKSKPTHHVLIIDRSGSMGWTINPLIDNVIERAKSFKIGDSITVGFFSGEGEFRFPLKGFQIGGVYELEALSKVLDTLRTTLSTTCFSEILTDLSTVLIELEPLSKHFTLTLFTDGCPVVSDTKKEESAIFAAIKQVASKLDRVLLVGYGGYYNKSLMTRMAEAFGGALVHAGDIPTFAVSYEEFTKDTAEARVRVPVRQELLSQPISLQGRQVNVHSVERDEEGTFIQVAPHTKTRTWVYYLVSSKMHIEQPSAPMTLQKNNAQMHTVHTTEALMRGAYGMAYTMSQQGRTTDALDVLGALGDVALIDEVNNAFTIEDYGQAEHRIAQAITVPTRRFTKGRKEKYLPKNDAFCVLDVLDLLMSDERAHFYPRHPEFQYKRIGKATKAVEGYPKFVANESAQCAFTTLNWHKDMLNLSVLAKIPGIVNLGEEAKDFGFSEEYFTYVWRNYAIIKDGMLNVTKLPVSVSVDTYDQLNEPMDFMSYPKDGIVTLDLRAFPVMNRTMAEGRTSATELCTQVKQELELMAFIKVLRWQRNTLDKPIERTLLTEAQIGFLESRGIGKNGFHPPVIQEPSTDFYYAKSFSVTAKGFSSLPPVEKTIEKLGKKMTPAETLLEKALIFVGFPDSPVHNPAWLDREIAERTKALREVRVQIQRTKFAVILGKRWFDEFSSREEATLTVDGLTFNFTLRDDVKVEI